MRSLIHTVLWLIVAIVFATIFSSAQDPGTASASGIGWILFGRSSAGNLIGISGWRWRSGTSTPDRASLGTRIAWGIAVLFTTLAVLGPVFAVPAIAAGIVVIGPGLEYWNLIGWSL
jgi:hypothetical protein